MMANVYIKRSGPSYLLAVQETINLLVVKKVV